MPNLKDLPAGSFSTTPPSQGIGNIADLQPGEFKSEDDYNQEKYSTPGQIALTAAEGAGHGFAGPLATGAEALASKAGVPGISPEEQEARAKAHPIIHYGSEILGFGLGALTGTGEAGLLAKFGEGAATAAGLAKAGTLGTRIASAGVRGAAELSAYQAGEEVSKTINQDPGQTLGSAAINVGLSGLMGGAGGVILGSVPALWKAYTQGAAEEAGMIGAKSNEISKLPWEIDSTITGEGPSLNVTQAKAYPSGPDEMINAIQNPKEKESFIDGLKKQKDNAEEIKKAGSIIGAPVSPAQTSASDYVQSMESALSQSPTIAGIQARQSVDSGFEKIGQILDNSLGAEVETTPYQRGQISKEQIQKTADDIYQPLKDAYALRSGEGNAIDLADEARLKQYNKLVEMSQGFGSVGSKGGKLIREAAERFLPQNNVSQLDEFIKELNNEKSMAYRAGDTHAATALGQATESIKDFQINQIARAGRALQGMGVEQAEQAAKEIIQAHKDVTKRYAEYKGILSDLASYSKLGRKATTATGLEDVLESIPNEKFTEKMFDPKNYDGLKKLKEKFPDTFKTVVDGKKADILKNSANAVAALKTIDKLSPEVKSLMFTPQELEKLNASKLWIDSLPKNVGPSGTPKGMAYMQAINGHPIASIINNAKDFTIKQILKFSTPREAELNKVATDYIKTAVKGEKTLNMSIKNLFRTGEVLPKNLLPDDKSREKLEKSLASLDAPDNLLRAGGDIGHYMPNHGTEIAAITATAKEYLNSLKPKQSPLTAFDALPPIDRISKTKYHRALDIAEQPLMALKHAKDGTLTPGDVKTLQVIYPKLHSAIAQKLNDEMIDQKSRGVTIPHKMRNSLSLIMGSPLDTSQTPYGMQAIIHSAANQTTPQAQAHGPKKASAVELKQINKVNNLYQTDNDARRINHRA